MRTLLILLLIALPSTAMAQQIQLTPAERTRVLSLIPEPDIPATARLANVPDRPRVLCELTARRHTADDGAQSRIVTTYHFDYTNGRTIRNDINVDTEQVLATTVLEGYTPPLAPEERLRVLEIAITQEPQVRALYDSNPTVTTSQMPSTVVDRDSDRFGHRLSTVQFRVKRPSGGRRVVIRVIVDLTDGTIIAPAPPPAAANAAAARDPEGIAASVHTIEQLFPLEAAPEDQQTGWRITFGTEYHGAGEILYIQEAHFRRSASDAWIQVLGDCRLAEMFVPYNDGFTRFYDITAIGGSLETLHRNDFGPRCLGTPALHLGDTVAVEFHDSRTLWVDHDLATDSKSRRGEEMHIWAVLPTGNYAYIMLYTFRSDGTVGFFVAPTAHNLVNDKQDSATHLHMGCWRLNVVLGDADQNKIETLRFKSSATLGAKAETVVEPFNGGNEGGIRWTPEDLLRLRISSKTQQNNYDPPEFISYELLTSGRQGNGRTYGVGEEWTANDLWVTRPNSPDNASRMRYCELTKYVSNPLPLDGQTAVIWCQSTLIHRARDEDFGPRNHNADEGVAIAGWTGFVLSPRNFFSRTPLYP